MRLCGVVAVPVKRPIARRKKRIKFCPKCGSVLYPTVRDGRKILVCPKCGYEEEAADVDYTFVRRAKRSPKDRIIIVDTTQPPPTAVVLKGKIQCPKCGNDEIYFWMQQTRAADEPPTRFYRCPKCGYSWREYE